MLFLFTLVHIFFLGIFRVWGISNRSGEYAMLSSVATNQFPLGGRKRRMLNAYSE